MFFFLVFKKKLFRSIQSTKNFFLKLFNANYKNCQPPSIHKPTAKYLKTLAKKLRKKILKSVCGMENFISIFD